MAGFSKISPQCGGFCNLTGLSLDLFTVKYSIYSETKNVLPYHLAYLMSLDQAVGFALSLLTDNQKNVLKAFLMEFKSYCRILKVELKVYSCIISFQNLGTSYSLNTNLSHISHSSPIGFKKALLIDASEQKKDIWLEFIPQTYQFSDISPKNFNTREKLKNLKNKLV